MLLLGDPTPVVYRIRFIHAPAEKTRGGQQRRPVAVQGDNLFLLIKIGDECVQALIVLECEQRCTTSSDPHHVVVPHVLR